MRIRNLPSQYMQKESSNCSSPTSGFLLLTAMPCYLSDNSLSGDLERARLAGMQKHWLRAPSVDARELDKAQTVTESKLIQLAARQANIWRDELLGQGIMTLFRRPADQEGGGLVSQRTILPRFRCQFLLWNKEGEVKR